MGESSLATPSENESIAPNHGGQSKLYIGNLPTDATEKLFAEHLAKCCGNLDMTRIKSIIVKRGYGFIGCADQVTADTLIDKLPKHPFYGAILNIEPAVPNTIAREPPIRVVFSSPDANDLTLDDVEEIINKWGGKTTAVHKRPDVTGIHGGGTAYIATINRNTDRPVDELVTNFNGSLTKSGSAVKVKIVGRIPKTQLDESLKSSNNTPPLKIAEFPLRILVPANSVGAIIGRGGLTIKDITQKSGARVNIMKTQAVRPYSGSNELEKIVTINGTPHNNTAACKMILEVLVEDITSKRANSESDIRLHILAYNSLIGRVIGKAGCNIKMIMQDTQTKIQVTNQTEYQHPSGLWSGTRNRDVDRVITVRGSIEGMTNAESQISAKLKAAYDADQRTSQIPYVATIRRTYDRFAEELVSNFNGPLKYGANVNFKIMGEVPKTHLNQSLQLSTQDVPYKTTELPLRILVPANSVGAIIGRGGLTIKDITQKSGARVNIMKTQAVLPYSGSNELEKIVTINGTPHNNTAACKMILEILVEDITTKRANSESDICLHILAYNSLIGRVIGKAGCNIKMIMQDTQTKIQVSNQTEYQSGFWNGFSEIDRVITVRGSIDGMTNAESQISAKLKAAYDADQQIPCAFRQRGPSF